MTPEEAVEAAARALYATTGSTDWDDLPPIARHELREAVLPVVQPLLAEIDRLNRALAGHLFDGESLSTREAIRSELILQGFAAQDELDRVGAAVRAEHSGYHMPR
jgi:hypothetical protein